MTYQSHWNNMIHIVICLVHSSTAINVQKIYMKDCTRQETKTLSEVSTQEKKQKVKQIEYEKEEGSILIWQVQSNTRRNSQT